MTESTIKAVATDNRPCYIGWVAMYDDGGCIYCGLPFGAWVYYRGKLTLLQRQVEHLIPRAFRVDNSASNLAEACQICNRVKSSFVFDSIEEARAFVQEKLRYQVQAYMYPLSTEFQSETHGREVLRPAMPVERVEREEPTPARREFDEYELRHQEQCAKRRLTTLINNARRFGEKRCDNCAKKFVPTTRRQHFCERHCYNQVAYRRTIQRRRQRAAAQGALREITQA